MGKDSIENIDRLVQSDKCKYFVERYRQYSEIYDKFAKDVSEIDRQNYIPRLAELPNLGVYLNQGRYGYVYQTGKKLPSVLIFKAKEILDSHSIYCDRCFCEAVPELAEKFHDLFHFTDWIENNRDKSSYLAESGKRYSEKEVFERQDDKFFETREEYVANIIIPEKELADEIAQYFESLGSAF